MKMRKHALHIVLAISLMGCASTQDVAFPTRAETATTVTATALVEKYMASRDGVTTDAPQPNQITDLVRIPALDQYIQTALKHNPGLQQSVTALKILYAQSGVTNAGRLPSVDASFSRQDDQDKDKSYTGKVTVSWELDVWGRIRDTTLAADKDIASSTASLQEARDVLVANIMRSWLEVCLYQKLVRIEERRLAVLDNNEALVLRRYQVGLGSLEDLDDAKTSRDTTRSTLADYRETLEKAKRNLILLTGQWNGEVPRLDVPSEFPQVMSALSVLNKQTLSHRPDVRAAFNAIEAESLRTDAAYKALLPSIDLTGTITSVATKPADAFFASSLWSLLGQISAPLFQGGKLRSEIEVAELTTEKSFWAYQETLLTAVNEVENAVGQETALAKRQQYLQSALQSAQRSLDTYRNKYRQGLVEILDLLTIQQQAYDTEAKLVNVIYERLDNRIDLGLALGLGYSDETQ